MIKTRKAISPLDPVWDRIAKEAQEAVDKQPLMGGLIHACILHHPTIEKALSYRIAAKLCSNEMSMVILREIPFYSMCEHHLVPFHGTASVGYIPGDHLVGLGRLADVVEVAAARPQVQERLTEQIADALEAGLAPRGVLVVLGARHECVAARGPRQHRSSMVTVAARGELAEPARRAEVLALVGAPDPDRAEEGA